MTCNECWGPRTYIEKYDSYACMVCDKWLEGSCMDRDCVFCGDRPFKPSLVEKE